MILENYAKCAEKVIVYLKWDKISETLCVDIWMFVVAGNIILPLNSSSEMVLRC
jgi:hypothetical protein